MTMIESGSSFTSFGMQLIVKVATRRDWPLRGLGSSIGVRCCGKGETVPMLFSMYQSREIELGFRQISNVPLSYSHLRRCRPESMLFVRVQGKSGELGIGR